MTAFFLTFLAVALAMFAGREAVRVSRLVRSGISAPVLFGVIALCGIGACALAAWVAGTFADLLSARQKSWFVAAALVLAALEVQFLDAPKEPTEPTRSLGAIAIVLFAGVLADASGLLVLSLAVASGSPILAGAGGAVAVIGVLGGAVMAAGDWDKLPRNVLRPIVAILLVSCAALIGYLNLLSPR